MSLARGLEQKFNTYRLANHELIPPAEFSREATANLV